jgi:SAM-dependent methyltransferase
MTRKSFTKKELLEERRFLFECEAGCPASIPGKQRFLEFLKIVREMPAPRNILDMGGNKGTERWLQHVFPGAKITILNNSEKQVASCSRIIRGDAQDFTTDEKYDLIFAGEIIEHLYNPDGLIASCLLALRPGGHLVLTTPNLACFYNRVFLLLGWSPAAYFPSLRYHVGNPLLPATDGRFGIIADHKSVFTWKGLKALLGHYGAEILEARGYTYAQDEVSRIVGDRFYRLPMVRWRFFLNALLPKSLREGMLFVCRRPAGLDDAKLGEGRLRQKIWEIEEIS